MLINVTLGGKTKYLKNGVPYVEGGTFAIMDTDELVLKQYKMEDSAYTNGIEATEYWLNDELVHRSLAIELVPLETMLAKRAEFG